jgi:hypothetical protein
LVIVTVRRRAVGTTLTINLDAGVEGASSRVR